ncbi:hypothetical protein G9444_5183 [Rhodococcus erythropolis]|uniref:Uncharacterized protein n=1 Tax=Rhodococcus erythropolis TaxID=1833 RepID=A0A6G9D0E1_RHOER|nr:hypothetical protein G9444_5183 [Rhodococcus erythropolis]
MHVGRGANLLPGPQLWMQNGQSRFDGRTKLLVECWFRSAREFVLAGRSGGAQRSMAPVSVALVDEMRGSRNGSILLFARGSLFSASSFVDSRTYQEYLELVLVWIGMNRPFDRRTLFGK